jgi:integrase
LVLFEQWLARWLEQLSDPAQHKILQTYATWSVLRRLRRSAEDGPLGPYREQAARCGLRAAVAFLDDLASHGVDLAGCRQADLDRWLATASDSAKKTLWPFFTWAIRTRRMPRLSLPPLRRETPKLISLRERAELLRRIHVGDDMNLTERVIAMLILLYAQPLSRITRLSVDDITLDEHGEMLVRLGDPPAPVPAPFAAIIKDYLASRPNLTTAANPNSTWLFPGQSAGQPLHPTSIRTRLHRHGIPNLPGRSRALRELVAQAPPSVVAGMLGYSVDKAAALAAKTGVTYHHYAAGDHARTRSPRLEP